MGPWRQTGSSLVRRALSGEEVDVFTESPSSASSFTTIPASTAILKVAMDTVKTYKQLPLVITKNESFEQIKLKRQVLY